MARDDPEIQLLRENIHCAAILEQQSPQWQIDRKESTKRCLKYRRGKDEILILNHEGRGWWDPRSDAKGDVFDLVQHFEPHLNFGQVRKALRDFVGRAPAFPDLNRQWRKDLSGSPPADRWVKRPQCARHSRAWAYLAHKRRLPSHILAAASAADGLREGPHGSAWFAHRDDSGNVTHVEIRGSTYKGSLKGGTKTLFRFHGGSSPPTRFVLAEAPIDALSLAAIEGLRRDTLYAATGGGMGPPTIEAITHILSQIAAIPGAVFCSAADANAAGDRYALRHQELAAATGLAFTRLKPPTENGDWNDVLRNTNQRNLP
ncbi:MAG TPA: DUF3991 and TOPRIM domain-containing protein [Candidatus Dormibacteraeota bacterium]|nr:DUF3991 and TOPRIM domain-containing protein [Candidatus Dormibacteraeota bacterium]